MPLAVRPLICAVSNRRLLSPRDDEACERLVEWSAAVAHAGVDLVQLRERDLDDVRLLFLVRQVIAATRGSTAAIVVNDRTDIALAAGAAGVHLPAIAVPPDRVRRIVPEGFLVGRSIHDASEAVAVERRGGADYLMFGTVFPSASKPAEHALSGVDGLRGACETVKLPVIAIGGITVERAGDAARVGAAGVAAIGLFHGAWTPDGLSRIVQGIRRAFSAPAGERRPLD